VARTRIDPKVLYVTLDHERRARGVSSWRALASQLEIPPSTFTRMANGQVPNAHAFATLVKWLGVEHSQDFLVSDQPSDNETPEPDLLTELAPLLRARSDLSEQDVEYLEDLIGAAMKRFKSESSGV
jgi:hypothetical protein